MTRWSRRAECALVLVLALIVGDARSASAYLKFGVDVNGRTVTLKWAHTPVRYFVSNRGVPGVSPIDFQNAVAQAFTTWESVPTASITYVFGGVTDSVPGADDGRSTLGFLDQPQLDRVLASTDYVTDELTGELVESDIFFNTAFPWSVAPNGERDRWDLQSIATHEIGHFNGLGHSAIGETETTSVGRRVLSSGAVMFPIALSAGDVSGRQLKPDDIAGVSDLYPDGRFRETTGSISGQVTKNGAGLFGAHVVAFNPSTGALIGGFSLDTSGAFSIAGLTPGPQLLRIEPVDDADTDSFFDHGQPVDLNFRVKFYERLVVVPAGGDSGTVRISVQPK